MTADEWAASILDLTVTTDSKAEFKRLVANAITVSVAEERERCAKVADRMALGYDDLKKYPHDEQEYVWQRAKYTAVGIAAAIRKMKP